MFYSNTSVYLYYPDTSSPNSVYVYNVSSGSFTQNKIQDSIPNGFMTQYTQSYRLQSVSIPATAMAYYAGTASSGTPGKAKRNEDGLELVGRDQGTDPWMRTLDLASGSLAWTEAQGTPPLLDFALLEYIRAGANGTLIAFGGADVSKTYLNFSFSFTNIKPKPASHTQFSQPSLDDIRDMSDIFVYDIASSTW